MQQLIENNSVINLEANRDEFYTNYPFYKYWKSDSNNLLIAPAPLNIYIHIPFCIQICDYCFYMKELIRSKDQVDTYIDSLCKEIKMVSNHFGLEKRRVNSIYVGGGTPSVLSENQLRKIMNSLNENHKIDSQTEFTLEVEPGTFNKFKLEIYSSIGVNRISMGVQSFNDKIIKLSNRKHSRSQALNSISMINSHGSFSVNVDLLSGLAGENMDTWKETLETAISQPIHMLTIYKMKTYSNTIFFKKGVLNNEINLPSPQIEASFMKFAIEKLSSSDLKPWSSFAFVRNNYKHLYAENTWRGEDLIGYGVSAFGKVKNINYQNVSNINNYIKNINNSTMPIARSYVLTHKDEIIKEILLCVTRLSSYKMSEFEKKFGFNYFNLIPETKTELIKNNFIIDKDSDFDLTPTGILYADFIAKVIASKVKEKIGKDTIGFSY